MDGSPMRAFVYCDGEAKQIKVFNEPEMLQLLSEHLIDLGKSPASSSGIAQASDLQKFFMGSKTVADRSQHYRKRYERDIITERLSNVLLTSKLHRDFQLRLVRGIQLVHYACYKILTQSIITDGYNKCGQWPLNIHNAMRLCSMSISKTAYDHMTSEPVVQKMMDIYRTKGMLHEADMDAEGIIKVDDTRTKPKDARAPHQQRALLLNASYTLNHFQVYKTAKENAMETAVANRAARAAAKLAAEQEKISKRTAKEQAKRQKQTIKAAADAYKAWYASLSPAAKKEERDRVKAGNKTVV